jgi:hypothetical protein
VADRLDLLACLVREREHVALRLAVERLLGLEELAQRACHGLLVARRDEQRTEEVAGSCSARRSTARRG